MRVHNVHSRELPAPIERACDLVAVLASEHDALWPIERWPTSPIELDRPLGPGAKRRPRRHPLRRRAVRAGPTGCVQFARKSGLDGIHVLEVKPIDARRSRLTHTLDPRVGWKLMALHPVLRAAHDALIEDLLDNAERAAGGSPAAAAAAAAPGRQRRRARRHPSAPQPARWIVPGTLGGDRRPARGLGARLPLAGRERPGAGRPLVGHGAELPPDWLTWLVAAMLLTGAAIVRAGAGGARGRLRLAAWAVAGVLLARGAVYVPIDLVGGLDDTYSGLDLAIYSPLCLALGAGTVRLLTRAPDAVTPRISSAVSSGPSS